jgi:hypothetical protein
LEFRQGIKQEVYALKREVSERARASGEERGEWERKWRQIERDLADTKRTVGDVTAVEIKGLEKIGSCVR